jgi:tetratricopeptide (TPR) repeat protein
MLAWTASTTHVAVRKEGVLVGAAWAQAFHDLQPDAQQVVRTCAVLGHPALSLATAAALLDTPVDRVTEILIAAREHGWGTVADDRFEVFAEARAYLRELATATSEADARLVADRAAAAIARSATVTTPSVRGDVITVLRWANRHRRPDLAAQVARAAWRTADPETEHEWCGELAEHGEEAAIGSRNPDLLIELLNLSATAYSTAGDWQRAERAWLRALAVAENRCDSARFVHFLGLLATNYRDWGRPHKAADTLLEIVTVRERGDDPAKTAEAIAAVGTTLFDARRLDAAAHYLGQADRLLRDLSGDAPGARALHATVLSDLGRVHASGGSINTARTFYHQALTLALDTDEGLVQRIRDSQAVLPPT